MVISRYKKGNKGAHQSKLCRRRKYKVNKSNSRQLDYIANGNDPSKCIMDKHVLVVVDDQKYLGKINNCTKSSYADYFEYRIQLMTNSYSKFIFVNHEEAIQLLKYTYKHLYTIVSDHDVPILNSNKNYFHRSPQTNIKNTRKFRKPLGCDRLFYIVNDNYIEYKDITTRYSSTNFEKDHPGSSYAFFPNNNLNNAPQSGKGLLAIVYHKHVYNLAILLHGNTKGGMFLIWNGNPLFLKVTTFLRLTPQDISQFCNIKYYNYEEVVGCFVSQVYGPRLSLSTFVDHQYSQHHFAVSPLGPDHIKVPDQIQIEKLKLSSLKDVSSTSYNTIYVVPQDTLPIESKSAVSIQISDSITIKNGFMFAWFTSIEISSLNTIPRNTDRNTFYTFISRHQCTKPYQRLIPPSSSNIKIKSVTIEEFEALQFDSKCFLIELDKFSVIVGTEVGHTSVNSNVGVHVLSTTSDSSSSVLRNTQISFDTVEDIINAYGNGHDRNRCQRMGFATYRGQRNTKRPFPRPSIASSDIPNHQYFNANENKCPFIQVSLESLIEELGQEAKSYGRREMPELFSIIEDSCDKSILTCGHPSRKNSSSNFMSFSCSTHIDTCDNMNQTSLRENFQSSCISPHSQLLFSRYGATMPTVCQYYHIWENNKSNMLEFDVCCSFMVNTFGIAISLVNNCSIVFLGGTFSHGTSFCYLVNRNDDSLIHRNDPNLFCMLAWGKSGNSMNRLRTLNEK
jgi:hypothetical protein